MPARKTATPTTRLRSRRLAPIVVGSACFVLGSGALAWADWIPPGHVDAIGDPSTPGLTLSLTSAGEMTASDQGMRTRLDTLNNKLLPLAIDPQGDLQVSVQGEAQVNGHVSIDNLPPVQQVAGTVAIENIPAITVSNLPQTQNVTGTVNVANLPQTQNVTVTGGTFDIQPTAKADDSGGFELYNDNTSEVDYFNAEFGPPAQCPDPLNPNAAIPCGPPPPLPTQKFLKLDIPAPDYSSGAGVPPQFLTLVSVNVQSNLAFICTLDHKIIFRMHIGSNTVREFVHPLRVDACYLECVKSEPELFPPGPPKCQGNFSIAGLE